METREYRPLTVGDWLITLIVLAIPLVGIIMAFVWAFSADVHPSKKTYCQAWLILAAAAIVLAVIGLVVLGGFAYLTAPHVQPEIIPSIQ